MSVWSKALNRIDKYWYTHVACRLQAKRCYQFECLNAIYYDQMKIPKENSLLRVLFLGCEHSSFEASFIRIFNQWNIKNEVLSFSELTELAFQEKLYFFKPHLIIAEDVRKMDLPFYVHENLFFLTSLDSNYTFLYTDDTKSFVEEMDEKNLFLLPYMNPERDYRRDFVDSTWYKEHIVKFPFVCDQGVFRTYQLTEEEYNKYHADICVVTNNSGYAIMDEIIYYWYDLVNIQRSRVYELIKEAYELLKIAFYEETREKETYVAERERWKEISYSIFEKVGLTSVGINNQDLDTLWRSICYQASELAWREATVDWLIEAGYDIKLWGGYWNKPLYAGYDMGRINSPVELSKMYNATKINLCTLPLFGVHRRTFEGILSNCFPLLSTTGDYDWSDITKYYKMGEEIDQYINREDLLKKVDLYLENDMLRKSMIHRQKTIIETKALFSDQVHEVALKEAFSKMRTIEG